MQAFADDPQCNDLWNLDYELEDDSTVPDALILLSEKTFQNYTTNIKNCEDDTTYPYILDEQFLWDLR